MNYTCQNTACDLYANCPCRRKLAVLESGGDDETTGLAVYFATCDETGYVVTNLSEDDVKATPTRRSRKQLSFSAEIAEGRFLHDRKYSVLIDTVHKRPEYAIGETDYVGINSEDAREIIKRLIRAIGKGKNDKGWVKSEEHWHLRFQGAAARRFKKDQIEVGTPFADCKYYWRIIPDGEFDTTSPKGKLRKKTRITFGKGKAL